MNWSARLESALLRRQRLVLPGILLIGAALRLYRLGAANLWWDEALAVWAVRKGLVGVTLWTAADVHPPLFFWSLWAWSQALGESEFALRLLPALYGVLTIAAVYGLGRLLGGERTGQFAALLTALSRFHVWWSQELRMYVLSGLLGVLSLYLFLRWLRAMRNGSPIGRKASRLLLAGYALSTLGALYTIFLSGAWVVVQNLVVLATLIVGRGYRRRQVLAQWALSQLAIAAMLALWLWFSWGRMTTWSVSEPVSALFVARLYAILLTAGASVDIERYLWTTALPLVTALLGTALLLRRQLRERDTDGAAGLATLLLSVLVPPVIVYLSTLPRSLFYTPHIEARYFLPFAPAFWVLLAWALVSIGRRWRAVGVALGLVIVVIWLIVLPGHYAGRILKDDYRTMTRAIFSQAEAGDVVLLDSDSRYPLFLYAYDRLPHENRPPLETVPACGDRLSSQDVDQWLQSNADRHGRIWLAEIDVNLSDPDRVLRQALDERYGLDWAEQYGHNTLLLFAPGEVAPSLADGYRPETRGDAGSTTWGLRGWDILVDRYTRGDLIWATLYWDRAPTMDSRLELVNRHETVIASRMVGTAANSGPARERITLPVTEVLPSGTYDLRLVHKDGQQIDLRRVRITSRDDLALPRGPSVRLNARFTQGVTLEGYTVLGARAGKPLTLQAGDKVVLDLYWRATGQPERDWTVFTHLVGQTYNPATSGPLWGQQDGMPGGGHWPTGRWQSGETGIDRYVLAIDPQAPAGDYTLAVGMYDGTTGLRAAITLNGAPAGDQLVAETVIRIQER